MTLEMMISCERAPERAPGPFNPSRGFVPRRLHKGRFGVEDLFLESTHGTLSLTKYIASPEIVLGPIRLESSQQVHACRLLALDQRPDLVVAMLVHVPCVVAWVAGCGEVEMAPVDKGDGFTMSRFQQLALIDSLGETVVR